MNIIIEKRDSIIRDNNTAQEYLQNIIENLSDSIPELTINEPLHGDLDLSILKRFSNIQTLSFGSGELTSIKNIPKSVKKLVCSQNMLIGFENISDELEELVCDQNFIDDFVSLHHSKIRIIRAEDNKLTMLKDLPKDLEELYVENNQIKNIDFKGTKSIKVLHANNNPILMLTDVPESLVDLQINNNPIIQTLGNNHSLKTETSHNIDYVETLNDYFKLKSKYEMDLHHMRKESFSKGKTSKSRKRLASLIKPKCVNCNRPVGTIFSRKDEHYTAICGDSNPTTKCSLKIDIFRSSYNNLDEYLYLFREQTDMLKDNIIIQKLDTLFGYTNQQISVKRFEKALESYNQDSKMYRELLEKYNSIHHSDTTKTQIIEKTAKIFDMMDAIQKMKDEYTETKNPELLQDAMDMQINVLQPEIENLRRLKYPTMESPTSVDKIGIGNTYKVETNLLQKNHRINDMEYTFGEEASVLHYRMAK